ncbi:MAG TPA: hypothetical protein VE956_14660 [Nodularia sp. (in: cyanobacteria)]|nr:hypothetical protein [Nodularia sp. (in: cyanobacteria)]
MYLDYTLDSSGAPGAVSVAGRSPTKNVVHSPENRCKRHSWVEIPD